MTNFASGDDYSYAESSTDARAVATIDAPSALSQPSRRRVLGMIAGVSAGAVAAPVVSRFFLDAETSSSAAGATTSYGSSTTAASSTSSAAAESSAAAADLSSAPASAAPATSPGSTPAPTTTSGTPSPAPAGDSMTADPMAPGSMAPGSPAPDPGSAAAATPSASDVTTPTSTMTPPEPGVTTRPSEIPEPTADNAVSPSASPAGDPTAGPIEQPPASTETQSPMPTEPAPVPPGTVLPGASPLAPNLVLTTTKEWHVARRAAQAPTAEMAAQIAAVGIDAWLDSQLNPASIDDSVLDGYIEKYFPWSIRSAKQVSNESGGQPWRSAPETRHALVVRPMFTKRVLLESVIEVLGDHIYVPIFGKGESFANEADQIIRKGALSRYADLLHAMLTNPALLLELDNQNSTKASPNENLGRELLELYTVGVGHYSERDVRQSALLLTGHSYEWSTMAYRYRSSNHHIGPLKIMDFSTPNSTADGGPAVLKQYVEYLAKHHATAARLAQKLAVRFVSDTPSDKLVAELAQVYLANDTRIAPVVRALFTHPEFYASVGHKWKRPLEYIATIGRAGGITRFDPKGKHGGGSEYDMGTHGWLMDSGAHLPRTWPAVNGYPDTARYWNNASVTLNMWNRANHAVQGDLVDMNRHDWAATLGVKLGDNVIATAKKITLQLTGYTWNDVDLAHISAMLCSAAQRQATSIDKISDNTMKWWLQQTVRLIFASPYAFLR